MAVCSVQILYKRETTKKKKYTHGIRAEFYVSYRLRWIHFARMLNAVCRFSPRVLLLCEKEPRACETQKHNRTRRNCVKFKARLHAVTSEHHKFGAWLKPTSF